MACDGSAVDRVGDDREDVVDLGAEEGQGYEGNDDNQRDDKGVLGEALSALVAAFLLTHGRDASSGTGAAANLVAKR